MTHPPTGPLNQSVAWSAEWEMNSHWRQRLSLTSYVLQEWHRGMSCMKGWWPQHCSTWVAILQLMLYFAYQSKKRWYGGVAETRWGRTGNQVWPWWASGEANEIWLERMFICSTNVSCSACTIPWTSWDVNCLAQPVSCHCCSLLNPLPWTSTWFGALENDIIVYLSFHNVHQL